MLKFGIHIGITYLNHIKKINELQRHVTEIPNFIKTLQRVLKK